MSPGPSRRGVLAGLGGAGALALGVGLQTPGRPPYTTYTYAQTTKESRLRVAWYETYNGEVLTTQGDDTETNGTRVLDPHADPVYVAEPSGPGISVANVLPGDAGSLAVGLSVEPDAPAGLDVWLGTSLPRTTDPATTEPERVAEQTASTTLATAIETRVWLDGGLVGLGGCDGQYGTGDRLLRQPASLGNTLAALSTGRRVATCLDPGGHVCVGLDWALDARAGNAVQTDSVAFDLRFVGQTCEQGNPFDSGGETA